MIKDILEYNQSFVKNKDFKVYETDKYPNKKLAIVTCMDTRLIELLPMALGIRNGDAKIIKDAGGVISHPFGSVVRSLLIAVYELGVEDIMVIGHTDCGVQHMETQAMLQKMQDRGISPKIIESMEYCGIDFQKWLSGFDSVYESVQQSVSLLKEHPLFPDNINVYGFVMDSVTGELMEI